MIIAYILTYIASYFFAKAGHYYLSGIILILMAVALYIKDYIRTKNVINLRGLFSLAFVGGEGVSCLKLSYLQTDWSIYTWISFFLAFTGFYLAFEITGRLLDKKSDRNNSPAAADVNHNQNRRLTDYNRVFVFAVILCAVSLACFIFEAVMLGYVPLFVKGVPHAYSYFHISGVHYFTVSCVLVPAIATLWFIRAKDKSTAKIITMIITVAVAVAIPILCVSRLQLVFAVVMAVFVYISLAEKIPWKWIGITAAVMIAGLFVLTVARSHDAEYLNSIFEMKINLPVSISRVYIYIANNYDNFDCLVKQLQNHSMGLKMLFPLWALTGLKFMVPSLVDFPLFVTKEELTTVTLFYDFYYDFGIVGVLIASMLIGALMRLAERFFREKESGNEFGIIIYVQLAVYMALAFFTTWFSNPTTWFYLVISAIGYIICTHKAKAE